MTMKKAIVLLAGVVCLGNLAAVAADFWEKKKYTQWSEKECQKLLTDSPWTEKWIYREIVLSSDLAASGAPLGSAPGPTDGPPPVQTGTVSGPGSGGGAQVMYGGQLRSAWPIRQALVRSAELRAGYDKLPAEQRQVLDQQANNFLAARFTDTIVIYVTYFSARERDAQEMERYWRAQSTESLEESAILTTQPDRRVAVMDFVLPREGERAFQLVFPRVASGRPVVGTKDKKFEVAFSHPSIGNAGDRKSTRLNSSHIQKSRMPSSA